MKANPFTIEGEIMTFLRKALLLLTFVVFAFVWVPAVSADFGPKPTLDYQIVGVEGDYHAALLFPVVTADPVLADTMELYGWDDNPLFVALNGYRDPDGYALFQLYWGFHTVDGVPLLFNGYPNLLKMAILDDKGNIFISESIAPRLFHSSLLFDFTGHQDIGSGSTPTVFGSARERMPIGTILIDFLLRLYATVAIEFFILWMFRYRRKSTYEKALLVNGITQTVLTIGVLVAHYFWQDYLGALMILLLGELFVFAIEMAVYGSILDEKRKWVGLLYGFIANTASLGVSILCIWVSIE
ncbi:MAG: hypothetical protein Q8N15_04545 [Bacillota bacterium]|nr:hypothetical protein [Bacillota bacterium]